MTRLRKEDLSLYYYIKDTVLCNYFEKEENIPLCKLEEYCTFNSNVYVALTDMIPDPTEVGRGWVYFDAVSGTCDNCILDQCIPYYSVSGTDAHGDFVMYGTPEQSYRVVVYDANGDVISTDDYMIDYIDGRIITEADGPIPVSVDYYWNYVSVVDEWPAVEAAHPPVIVLDMQGTDKTGFQLGGGRKTTRKVDIHVFASNPAERNDIVEVLYDGLYLKSCPLYEFPTGSVLDYDGTFYGRRSNNNKLTSLFSRETVENVTHMEFDNVTARHVNLPLLMTRNRDEVTLSDLNAYRSKISFDVVSYTDV